MGYYPLFVDMKGRRCVVIGGGDVARRKVHGLLDTGAAVTVISSEITGELAQLVDGGKIKYVPRNYMAGDLADCELAFVATNDAGVTADVCMEGKSRGVWVNAADDPAHCDFILPSILRRGELTIAVSTGGKSPALSRAIREELDTQFNDNYCSLVDMAAEVRDELRRRSITPGYEAWRRALAGNVRKHIHSGNLAQAKSDLLRELGAAV